MGDRHAREIGRRHERGNSRHHLERHAGVCQTLSFFGPAPKEIRIPAHKVNYRLARARPADQQLV